MFDTNRKISTKISIITFLITSVLVEILIGHSILGGPIMSFFVPFPIKICKIYPDASQDLYRSECGVNYQGIVISIVILGFVTYIYTKFLKKIDSKEKEYIARVSVVFGILPFIMAGILTPILRIINFYLLK